MKTMTCRQLAGACDEVFHAETFEEMGQKSQMHAIDMALKNDAPHIEKMEEMKALMDKPEEVKAWFEKTRKEFDSLPEEKS